MFISSSIGSAGGSGSPDADHQRANRLIHEKSPYLQQHAQNPVDWFPWGQEALARARAEDKPIFLSIGYSTCHWCHVMERESFENQAIARLLNQSFIPVKVDREERPDLDNLYMSAVQALTGRGGWPMTVLLTPDLKPFFAGTYFPPDDRWGRPGLKSILEHVTRTWSGDRADIHNTAEQVTAYLRRHAEALGGGGVEPGSDLLDAAYRALKTGFDPALGGFGEAPKFPTPHNLTFLLRYAARTGSADAIDMVCSTLDAMAAGGIHDHLAGGFHRYSTDAQWLVPHFEKMLYDQAGLALAYTDAWLVTGDERYAEVTRGILDYVLAYLTDPKGGFYSAEDADSEGEEGTFYVWTRDEVLSILDRERGAAFNAAFGVTAGGNWEGKNILARPTLRPALDAELLAARDLLRAARDQRPRPHRDEKVIVAWNGYMIEALAQAGRALPEPRYIAAAEAAAGFIARNLWRDGRLMRHYRNGAAEAPGYLDDYAFLGRGLLALYEATFAVEHLEAAVKIAREMVRLFPREAGGFVFTGKDAESLLTPVVEIYDGAMPAGNSVAAMLLLRLGHLTGNNAMKERGRETLRAFQSTVSGAPANHTALMAALDFALGPNTEVVIAGPAPDPHVGSLLATLRGRYLPNAVTAFRPNDNPESAIALIPYLESQAAVGGAATAYVCRNYACQLPVQDAAGLIRQLEAN